jgi:hypothetical protein
MVNKIKFLFKNLTNFFNKTKQSISATYQSISKSMPVKIIYYFFRYFLWLPIKYSMLLCYYTIVWPFLKILSFASESSESSIFSNINTSNTVTPNKTQESRSSTTNYEIQTWEGSYWVTRRSGNSGSTIMSHEVGTVKEQNSGKRTRAISRDTRQVLDIA